MEEILLAGIAVTLGAGALAQGLQAIAGADALFASAQWSLGQLPQVGYDRVVLLLVPTLVCAVAILSQRRSLLALSLGEDWAQSVGVATNRVRLVLLVGGCLGVGASVALCGPIAFVGLLVPHVVRLLLGVDQTRLLPLSWISGGAFLVFSDLLAREILPQRELPVGVLTASLGSPALFLLILRRTPRSPVD
jgi:iron complex transport system permease protein